MAVGMGVVVGGSREGVEGEAIRLHIRDTVGIGLGLGPGLGLGLASRLGLGRTRVRCTCKPAEASASTSALRNSSRANPPPVGAAG